jgi:hypothetical protein
MEWDFQKVINIIRFLYLEFAKGPRLWASIPGITYGRVMAVLISYRDYDYTDQGRAFAKDPEMA